MEREAWLRDRRAAVEAATTPRPRTTTEPVPVEMQRAFVAPAARDMPAGRAGPRRALRHRTVLPSRRGGGLSGHRDRQVGRHARTGARSRDRGGPPAYRPPGVRVRRRFDAVMTVDAMENVFPEHWQGVLANLRRALRPGGHLYLTVEEIDEEEIERRSPRSGPDCRPSAARSSKATSRATLLPRPGAGRALARGRAPGVVGQDTEPQDGWAYWHFLLRAR